MTSLVNNCRGQQRDHGDHRADSDRHCGAVGQQDAVMEQPVVVVPKTHCFKGFRDTGEVLEELLHQVECGPVARPVEDRGDGGHRQCISRHPAGGIRLLEEPVDRKMRAVEGADVVQTHESTLKEVGAVGVFAIHPPGEVHQQLVEDAAEEVEVAATVDGEHFQRSPRLYRRVDIAEVPLVGGKGAVGVLEPLAAQQRQLILRERGIDVHKCDAMKCQVPGGEPRILPRVGHRHDVERLKAAPPRVAAVPPLRRRRRLAGVAVQPAGNVVVVELLVPQHAGERLSHDRRFIGRCRGRRQLGVELVGLVPSLCRYSCEVRTECGRRFRASAVRSQAQPHLCGLTGTHRQPVPGCALGAPSLRIDGVGACDNVVVDSVLRSSGGRRNPIEPFKIRIVVAEQQLRVSALWVRSGQQLEIT